MWIRNVRLIENPTSGFHASTRSFWSTVWIPFIKSIVACRTVSSLATHDYAFITRPANISANCGGFDMTNSTSKSHQTNRLCSARRKHSLAPENVADIGFHGKKARKGHFVGSVNHTWHVILVWTKQHFPNWRASSILESALAACWLWIARQWRCPTGMRWCNIAGCMVASACKITMNENIFHPRWMASPLLLSFADASTKDLNESYPANDCTTAAIAPPQTPLSSLQAPTVL